MKKYLLLFIHICIYIYSSNAQVIWEKGDGSQANPYQIESIEHLQYLAEQVNNGISYANTYFILTNDLDLSSVCAPNGVASGKSWIPIGNQNSPFSGILKGSNHQIKNLYICHPNNDFMVKNRELDENINNDTFISQLDNILATISPDSVYHGLFGYILGAKIDSLHLMNTYMKGIYFVGSIAGCADSSMITNCTNSGYVHGDYYVGGIAGRATRSTISKSINTSIVRGYAAIGGICGDVRNSSTLSFCLNSGMVSGRSANIGGISGILETSSLTFSINTGAVKGSSYAGAIVGNGKNEILTNCIYDKQLCVKRAIGYDKNKYGKDDDANFVMGKWTNEMLGDSLSEWINDSLPCWKYDKNMYPRPLGVENSAVAYVAAIPVFLRNHEHVDSVYTNFLLGKGSKSNPVAWITNDTNRIVITDSFASIVCFMQNDTVSISTFKDGAIKYVLLKVTNPIELPERPFCIYGPDTIVEAGAYFYYIDTIKGATTYEWKLSDSKWVGVNTKNTITLSIKDSGTFILSVKALNQCGESDVVSKEIKSNIEHLLYKFTLQQNIPNPVRTTTSLPFTLPQDGVVSLQIISIFGQVLYDESIEAKQGENQVDIDVQRLGSSIYYCMLTYKGKSLIKKICIQK